MALGMSGEEIERNSTALKGIESIALKMPPGAEIRNSASPALQHGEIGVGISRRAAFMADVYGRLTGKAGA